MIFNVTKINNRVFLDKGDIITALLKLSKSTRIDEPSTAVIVKLLEFVSETFDSEQPTERAIVPTYVIDYSLIDSLNKLYKKNLKSKKRWRHKKDSEELQQGLIDLEPPKPVEEAFNAKQIEQLNEIIKAQNELIQKLLLEQVKVIKELIPVVPEETKKTKEPKTKKAATT